MGKMLRGDQFDVVDLLCVLDLERAQLRAYLMAFKNRFQGMHMRKHVWICMFCHHWHDEKTKVCRSCQSNDLHYFPSTGEARRFAELVLLMRHGRISDLEIQVEYPIIINGEYITKYIADFRYKDQDGREVVEDYKPDGFHTELFAFKAKIVHAIYGITIKEV